MRVLARRSHPIDRGRSRGHADKHVCTGRRRSRSTSWSQATLAIIKWPSGWRDPRMMLDWSRS